MTRHVSALLLAIGLMACTASSARAQVDGRQFELGAHVVGAAMSEFDKTDFGVSGRFVWRPGMLIGGEIEAAWFPTEVAGPSNGRIEVLSGLTIGPRLGKLRPFGKVRTGFVKFLMPEGTASCAAVYPPPVACVARGARLAAFDLGGGLEVWPTDDRVVRIDVSDRMLHYDVPVLDDKGVERLDGFYGHDLRFSVGAGVRF